ncbi:MAG: hypothetical protein AAGC77_12735 [Pseudomonadota bacterium]
MKILSALSAAALALATSSAFAQDPMADCIANDPDATEEFCSCMISAVEADSSLLEEVIANGGAPAPGEGSAALEEVRDGCR